MKKKGRVKTLNTLQVVSLVQAAVFFLAGVSFYSIWKMGDPEERGQTSKDLSIVFFSIACLIWCLMAVMQFQESLPDAQNLPGFFRTLLSIVNTAFVVGTTAALEANEKLAAKLLSIVRRWLPASSLLHAVWILMGMLVGVGVVSTMALMLYARKYADLPDIFLGAASLWFVLIGLYKSFKKRQFSVLPWLSVVVIAFYIVVQLAELPWSAALLARNPRLDDIHWVANLSVKTMLCLLFMALIVSWMYEKALRPASGSLKPFLSITAPYEREEKNVFEIQFAYDLAGTKTVKLTEKGYLRVLEMALMWQRTGEPIKTKDLYHTSETEVRQDLKEVLTDTRVDPLFGPAVSGVRHPRIQPVDISYDLDGIRNWTAWDNLGFATAVMEVLESQGIHERVVLSPNKFPGEGAH